MSQIDLEASGPTSRIYFSQRLRLHYVDWGNPSAPPLLLVHGGRDHCRNWDWVATRLRQHWHILAPDLRGHGDSQWSPDGNYSTAAYVYDLAQLIHQQKLAPVTIVAHSLGGNIAIRYAGVYPETVRRLVAIEGLGLSPQQSARRAGVPIADRMRNWADEMRGLSGRIPAAIEDGRLEARTGIALSPSNSHAMLCGNPAMVEDTQKMLLGRGMRRHRRKEPGHITVETYW